MKSGLPLLLVILFNWLSFSVSAQHDSITIGAVPYKWSWINAPKDFKIISNNAISVMADKLTDQYISIDGSYSSINAPKLLFKPDTDFIFSAKVKTGFDSLYEGGAIILYSDAGNFVKLLFEKDEEHSVKVTSSVVTNKISDDDYHAVITGKEVYLKAAKAGKVFCFYYSTDGKHWNIVRTFAYSKTKTMRLGFYAQSPLGPYCEVLFSDISYKPFGFKDFSSGE